MTMTDNNATDWTDLLDQLTPGQIKRLRDSGHMQPGELLEVARDFATQNLLQASLADIALPAGAVRASLWYDDAEGTSREVYGTAWTVGTITPQVVGRQSDDGRTDGCVEIAGDDGKVADMPAAQIRELSAALLAAADELERLTGEAPPFQ